RLWGTTGPGTVPRRLLLHDVDQAAQEISPGAACRKAAETQIAKVAIHRNARATLRDNATPSRPALHRTTSCPAFRRRLFHSSRRSKARIGHRRSVGI